MRIVCSAVEESPFNQLRTICGQGLVRNFFATRANFFPGVKKTVQSERDSDSNPDSSILKY
jgi:hypothetical protein